MELLDAIKARLADPKGATDQPRSRAIGPILSPAKIEALEFDSGVLVPPLLRELYLTFGDGGFGPGYGFQPFQKLIDSVKSFATYEAPLPPATRPPTLALVVEWGCGIASLIDCGDQDARVLRFDPNVEDDEYPGSGLRQLAPNVYHESDSLESWLRRWLDGESLFYTGFGFTGEDDPRLIG